MTTSRLAHATDALARTRDMVALGQAVKSLLVGRVDSTDMYRAALVQAVSLMDHYFHGVVLDRAVNIMLGALPGSVTPSRTGLPFHAVREIVTAPNAAQMELLARQHAAARLGLETFQRPDDIANALAAVGIPKIWSTAYGKSGAGLAKTALGIVVTRRNRIVHQSDADPLNPGVLTPMSDIDALEAITTVERTILAIDPHC